MRSASYLIIAILVFLLGFSAFAQDDPKVEAQKLYNEGLSLVKTKQSTEAIKKLTDAVTKDPTLAVAYYALGLAYNQNRDQAKAEEAFRKAIENDDKMTQAYNALGLLYTRSQKYTEALNSFQALIGIDSTDSKAYFGIGYIYIKRKDYKNAIIYYEKAVKHKEDYAKAWLNLGTSYHQERRYSDAVPAFENALKYERKKTAKGDIYLRLGNALAKLNGDDSAIEAYKNCIASATKGSIKAAANFGLGEIYKKKGMKSQAISHFQAASRDRAWKQSADYEIEELNRQ